MQGPIFQVLALVTYGNAALSGRPQADFYPAHTAFAFTEYVRFVGLEPPREAWRTTPFAADPDRWLSKLRDGGCRGLRAWRSASADEDTLSDRFSVAFVGAAGAGSSNRSARRAATSGWRAGSSETGTVRTGRSGR